MGLECSSTHIGKLRQHFYHLRFVSNVCAFIFFLGATFELLLTSTVDSRDLEFVYLE